MRPTTKAPITLRGLIGGLMELPWNAPLHVPAIAPTQRGR